MIAYASICGVLEELIETMQFQAKEIERIVTHLEQQTGQMEPPSEMSVVASELSGLHKRVKDLGTAQSAESLR